MPRVAEPRIPAYTVRLTDFGVKADGQSLVTDAIAEAIAHLADREGGRLVVPRGIWLTGPIVFRNKVELHLEAGALLLFSGDFDLYPLVETSFEGLNTYRCQSPISGRNLEDIAITGEGVIDGAGDAWRPVKRGKLTDSQWKKLLASGGVLNSAGSTWYPSEKSLRGDPHDNFNVNPNLRTKADFEAVKDFQRPVLLSFVGCKRVLLDGPTFQNSPAWNLHPLMCEDLILRNLTVRNPWYSQNGDGLDIESCRRVLVHDCEFDVGDDAICIKSGKDEQGRLRAMPTEEVVVKRCVVYHGHGGFVVGSEMSGGVRNVHVSQCTFIGTDVGLRFKSTRGRGGIVENIYISDIDMVDIPAEPLRFNLFYTGNSPIPDPDQQESEQIAADLPPVDESTPQFREIYIRRVLCRGAGVAAKFQGLPEMNLQHIHLDSVTILGAKRGMEVVDARGISFRNLTVEAATGPTLRLHNVQEFDLPSSGAPLLINQPCWSLDRSALGFAFPKATLSILRPG